MRRPSIPPFDTYREYFTKNWLEWFDSLDNEIKQTRLLLRSYIAHATSGVTDHTLLTNIGTNTHAQLDTEKTSSESHRANALIHFEQADIDHTAIDNIGIYTHDELDIEKDLSVLHRASTSNPHSVTANQVLPSQATNSGKYLTTDGSNSSWATVTAGVSGSGTTNTIPLWTAGTTLGDSALTQSAGNVTCSGNFAVASTKVYKIDTTTVIDISGTNNYYGGGANVGGGSDNLMIGNTAGKTGGTWSYNIGVGYGSLKALTNGSENVAIGWGSMAKVTTGTSNVGIATSSMNNLLGGTGNVGIGTGGLQNITSGNYNFGLGNDALFSMASGVGNVGIGRQAGRFITGSENIAIGQQAGYGVTTQTGSVAIGFQTLYGCNGAYNTALGDSAGPAVASTANHGVYIGYTAGFRTSSGSKNVYIGYEAGFGASSHACSNTVVIGPTTMSTVNPASNRLHIDARSSVGADTLIYGEFDNAYIKINGGFGTAVSIKTADYTVTSADSHITLDGTSATVILTLPASPNVGQEYNFACVDSTNACEINPNGKNIYSSSANFPLYVGENLKIKYDGTRWVGA
jgi:hypothetical protein